MAGTGRRTFLKTSGLTLLPAIIPFSDVLAFDSGKTGIVAPASLPVKLFGDGEMYEPEDYLNELQKAYAGTPLVKDRYGVGGVIEQLEKKFIELTGKEAAIFMPSGTMSNQMAIAVLSGDRTKVYVQDTSHVYRDEADAAQSVFGKRLVPLAAGAAYFTAAQLKEAVEHLSDYEVFDAGIGAVSIENPVRRADGRFVPLDEIKKISAYCKEKNIKLHLDGARLFMASAWTGTSIKEYASHFDTVYVSLYKYLGASAGAMLCGPKEVIGKMAHLVKIHGGSMYGNWTNAAMALAKLNGFEERLKNAIEISKQVFAELNKIKGVNVSSLDNGTNIYRLQLAKEIDGKKLQERLNKAFNIRMPRPDASNTALISVNETLNYQSAGYLVEAFRKSIE